MTADMSHSGGRWFAWCETCQDGFRGSKVSAENWQFLHNNGRHPE